VRIKLGKTELEKEIQVIKWRGGHQNEAKVAIGASRYSGRRGQ
jgi:hypothetical protein